VISDRNQTNFEAEAWVGSTRINGKDIERVDFVMQAMGHTNSEETVRYCAFFGDASCNPMNQNKWDNLNNGSYVIKARACSAVTGDCTGWVSKSFEIQK